MDNVENIPTSSIYYYVPENQDIVQINSENEFSHVSSLDFGPIERTQTQNSTDTLQSIESISLDSSFTLVPSSTENDLSQELIRAATEGDFEAVQTLLAIPNISVNAVNSKGWTALMEAAALGNRQIVQALLSHPNINVNAISTNGIISSIWTAISSHTEKLGWTALTLAVENGYTEIVMDLLDVSNIQLNIPNDDGNTALIIAALKSHTKIIQELPPKNRTRQ